MFTLWKCSLSNTKFSNIIFFPKSVSTQNLSTLKEYFINTHLVFLFLLVLFLSLHNAFLIVRICFINYKLRMKNNPKNYQSDNKLTHFWNWFIWVFTISSWVLHSLIWERYYFQFILVWAFTSYTAENYLYNILTPSSAFLYDGTFG